eukprot:PhF_6_TR25844/c0_g1_i1/m.36513
MLSPVIQYPPGYLKRTQLERETIEFAFRCVTSTVICNEERKIVSNSTEEASTWALGLDPCDSAYIQEPPYIADPIVASVVAPPAPPPPLTTAIIWENEDPAGGPVVSLLAKKKGSPKSSPRSKTSKTNTVVVDRPGVIRRKVEGGKEMRQPMRALSPRNATEGIDAFGPEEVSQFMHQRFARNITVTDDGIAGAVYI